MHGVPKVLAFAAATAVSGGLRQARKDQARMPWKAIRRGAMAVGAVAGLVGAGDFGWEWWTVGRFHQTTDDAYLQADYSAIAPKVSGYIGNVFVTDNEHVTAGQVLARIDTRDFQTALNEANAELAAARDTVTNLDAQIALQHSIVDQVVANIDSDAAALTFAQQDQRRYAALMASGAGTVQRAEQSEATLRQATARLQHDRSGLLAAQQQITVLETERDRATSMLQQKSAAAHQAELNLGYTTIAAPIDGTVGSRSVRVGQYVQAGTQLMAIVPLHAVYVVANFKETQLTHVQAGQPARIEVDTFPDAQIEGRVDSLAPASGLEFALLPPDNATGNFTKIVQRIPVKIILDPGTRLLGSLRPGMSVEASIDTKATVMADQPDATRVAAR
jgi:membrane fusion protein (multidrug efflux system)